MNTTPNAPISDDELGAALGAGVRSRVDAVPTITPAFDGVERRARQITQRRRATAGLAIGALIVFGGIGLSVLAGDDEGADIDDVVTEPEPEPEEDVVDGDVAPEPEIDAPIVAADPVIEGLEVTALVDDSTRFIATSPEGDETTLIQVADGREILRAIQLADGTLVWGESSAPLDLADMAVWYRRPGGAAEVLAAGHALTGAAVIDDVPTAFLSGTLGDIATPGTFPLIAMNLLDGSTEVLIDEPDGDGLVPMDVDVRVDLLLVSSLSSTAGGEWRYLHTDGTPAYADTRISRSDGGTITRWSPRLSRNDLGIWWLESNTQWTEWWLVGGDPAGVERERIALDPEADGRAVVMNLEVTDDLMAVNILALEDEPLEYTTIWINPDDLSLSLEFEGGEISFIEPKIRTDGSTGPGGSLILLPETVDVEELGITVRRTIESRDWTPGDYGPIETNLAGLDENGVLWLLGHFPDGEDILIDLWSIPGATNVRSISNHHRYLVQLADAVIELNSLAAGDQGRIAAENARLVGAGVVGDDWYAFVVDNETDDLLMIDLRRDETTVIDAAVSQPPRRIESVHVAGDLVLIASRWNQPWFSYVSLSGADLSDLASPTDGRYGFEWGGPDNVQIGKVHGATLSADGSTLYWIEEGPIDAASFEPTVELHAMDIATGDEADVVLLTLPATQVRLDYGLMLADDQLLLGRSWPGPTTRYAAPIVIDPVAGTWAELELPAGPWAAAS